MSDAPSAAAAALGPIHSASTSGYSLANNALYDAGRPAYSNGTIDFLLEHTVLKPLMAEIEALQGADAAAATSAASTAAASSSPAAAAPASSSTPRVIHLVDVGAGTGIFTRCLWSRVLAFRAAHQGALQKLGVQFRLTAVEPVEGMRLRFAEKWPKEFGELDVCGSGEAAVSLQAGSGAGMPGLTSGSVDVVFAAQAFHWFATAAALRELSRVLRSDRPSYFCPLWNTRDESVPWVGALEQLIVPLYPADVPRQQSGKWKKVFDEPLEGLQPADATAAAAPSGSPSGSLHPFVLATSRHTADPAVSQHGGVDMVLARTLSLSVVACLPQAEKDQISEQVRALLSSHPDTAGREQFELSYVTDAYVYRKVAEPKE